MKLTFTLLLTILFSLSLSSQENSNTLDSQFDKVYKKSNSYQEYKVILKEDYRKLQSNVKDSIAYFNNQLLTKNSLINSQKNTIDVLEKEKNKTATNLTEALKKENSITLFGISFTKGLFKIILFTIIIALLVFLGFFVYKFKNSNVLTLAAKDNLEDVENEYTLFRKKSIEREQKLRRQLQDEIIKNKNS